MPSYYDTYQRPLFTEYGQSYWANPAGEGYTTQDPNRQMTQYEYEHGGESEPKASDPINTTFSDPYLAGSLTGYGGQTKQLLDAAAAKEGITGVNWDPYVKAVAKAVGSSNGTGGHLLGQPDAYIANLILREAALGTTGATPDQRFAAKKDVFAPPSFPGSAGYYDPSGPVYKATETAASARDDKLRADNAAYDDSNSFGSTVSEILSSPQFQLFTAVVGGAGGFSNLFGSAAPGAGWESIGADAFSGGGGAGIPTAGWESIASQPATGLYSDLPAYASSTASDVIPNMVDSNTGGEMFDFDEWINNLFSGGATPNIGENPFALQAAEEAIGASPGIGSFSQGLIDMGNNPLALQSAEEAMATQSSGGLPEWLTIALQQAQANPVGAARTVAGMAGANTTSGTTGTGGSTQSGTSSLLDRLLNNQGALGMGLGALAGSLGGAKQTGTTTSVTDIPDWLRPYAQNLVGKAGEAFDAQRGQTNGIQGAADAEYMKTLQGGYTPKEQWNPYGGMNNPYFENFVVNPALDAAQSRVNTMFAKNPNNYGSAGQTELLGKTLGQVGGQLRSDNFMQNANLWSADANRNQSATQAERSRQVGAATAAPSYLSASQTAQNAPYNQYKGILSGWGSQSTQPYYENPMANILGGGLAGYSFGKLFGQQ